LNIDLNQAVVISSGRPGNNTPRHRSTYGPTEVAAAIAGALTGFLNGDGDMAGCSLQTGKTVRQ
jgi:hypothetical protein